jgi:hypothetical protein
VDALRDDANCNPIADEFDAVLGCQAGLSCADFRSNEAIQRECSQQLGDLVAAVLEHKNTCTQTVDPSTGVGSSSSTSTSSSAGGGTGGTGGTGGAGGAGGGI